MIKAILFDIDGTLVDSNDQHVSAWDAAFRAAGHVFGRQVIHDQIGKGTDMLVPALIPDADEEAQQRLGEAHGAVFKQDYLAAVAPFPGAPDLLRRANERGQQVVLASSASRAELDHYVGLLDAGDLIAAGTSSDDVASTKPAPDIFATALAKAGGVDPGEVVAVGDTPYDMEAAGKCGVAAVGLLSGGFPAAALREAGAAAVYDDVAALLADYDGSPLGG